MLEICEPHELDRIRTIYCRDGFGAPAVPPPCFYLTLGRLAAAVVVKDLLTQEQLDGFREGCSRVLAELLRAEGQPEGHKFCTESGRLAHRYSYGTCSASRQQLHEEAWCNMIDLPTTVRAVPPPHVALWPPTHATRVPRQTPILKHLFGTDDYAVGGAGGDLSLPGVRCRHFLDRTRVASLKSIKWVAGHRVSAPAPVRTNPQASPHSGRGTPHTASLMRAPVRSAIPLIPRPPQRRTDQRARCGARERGSDQEGREDGDRAGRQRRKGRGRPA